MSTSTVQARPDTRDMVMVHRVFRREFAFAPRLVRSVPPGDTARAKQVASYLAELMEMLHHHHHGEDESVWPRLTERAAPSRELVARMQGQHERVSTLMEAATPLLASWPAGADAALGGRLADVLAELSPALDEHLAEEETHVLPLMEAHLSVAEYAELAEKGFAAVPKSRLLFVLGAVLEEATEVERQAFFGQVPLPGRIAYRLMGQRRYDREITALRAAVPAPRAAT